MRDWRGDPLSLSTEGLSDLPTRLQKHLDYNTVTGCWLWTASTYANGYGRTYDPRVKANRGAHRVVRSYHQGRPVGDGMVVDHLCGVILCCSPHHTEEVTNAENLRRGRECQGARASTRQQLAEALGRPLAPSANGRPTTLTPRQIARGVARIRAGESAAAVARAYKVPRIYFYYHLS